tara:strand:- start:457 stop:1074 length:618 start_codon:yes stop_codon:yes gene_type:complete
MDIKFYNNKFSYFTIDNYFTDPELYTIWPEIESYRSKFQSEEKLNRTGSVSAKGIFITNDCLHYNNISNKLFRVEDPYETYVKQDIHFKWMRNLLYSTKLLNYYDDNDFYDTHTDFSVYTMVVMLCKEPKRFMGGDFHLTDIDTKIEFQHNRIVFFPSFAGHKVDTVKMNSSDRQRGLGRYSITHFFYVPLDDDELPILKKQENR